MQIMNEYRILLPNSAGIDEASETLRSGGLVAFPTETVYGLGADALNMSSVNRIFSIKNRPTNHPLIVHISDFSRLNFWVRYIPQTAQILAETFWPGPMTLILQRATNVPDYITGGQDSVGIRIPGNQHALNLLKSFESKGGKGIAAPSANKFGKVSTTSASSVLNELGKDFLKTDALIDGGVCELGLESTIIDCRSDTPNVLRPGAITALKIENLLGLKIENQDEKKLRVSGNLDSHYSPNAELYLNTIALPGDGLIALSSYETPAGVIRLATPKDSYEYANKLYEALRSADETGIKRVVAIEPEGDGIEVAIRDRLRRAAVKLI